MLRILILIVFVFFNFCLNDIYLFFMFYLYKLRIFVNDFRSFEKYSSFMFCV